ncbi:MAG TPA: L-threonylcarbamoyladenylate synthase [Thermoanaerobaculia bacterium]|nr:L-threonylcarbamoyladenylate synthase [Thermoanaerobaculia bacterium]
MTPDITHLVRVLRSEGVALLPTDTIYGLHALATSEKGLAAIAAIKGRDAGKPFVVIGSSRQQLESIGARFTDAARAALDELWPGPLTAVVPLRAPIPASRGSATLGVRVPALPWLRQLAQETGPLASTSANRSGEPPLITPDELSPDLQKSIDAVLNGGRLEGKPSTIVDFTGDEPRLIREGEPFFTQKVWKTLRKSL